MNKKHNFAKIFFIIVCMVGVSFFALIESGETPAFVTVYRNNFKRNIMGFCNFFHIELPIETQLYLDDMSEPEPKPIMTPASEEDKEKEREELMYPEYEEETVTAKEGNDDLTAKEAPKVTQNMPTAFPNAENTRFLNYDGNIICANETSYSKYRPNGEMIWTQKIQLRDPILKTRGSYIMICETGGKKLSLYKDQRLLFTAEAEGNILTADLSANGDVIAVTQKEYYKGQVVVYNRKGKRIFAWDSGAYSILDAAISKGRKVAISLLSTDEGADSIIREMNVDGKELFVTDIFKNTIMFDVEFNGEELSVLSESKNIAISSKGKIKWEYDFNGRTIKRCCYAENGAKAILLDNSGMGEIVAVTANGKAYDPIKTENMPDVINIKSNGLAYNNGRNAVLTDFKGKRILQAECSGDIKQICIISADRLFCVYSTSIQEKTVRKLPRIKDVPDAE